MQATLRRRADLTTLLAVLALMPALVIGLAPASARADQWVVSPLRDVSPAAVTAELERAGLLDSLDLVLAALNGSAAFSSEYRLIDLATGEVLPLFEDQLAMISWVQPGGLTDAAKLADTSSGVVVIASNVSGMGPAVTVLGDPGTPHPPIVLSADQRQLVGEPPCDKGYVAASGANGSSGTTCVDIDECMAKTDDCAEHATCTNTDGAFECECDKGYEGDGTLCMAPDAGMPTQPMVDGGTMMMMPGGGDDSGVPIIPGKMMSKDSGCSCSVPGAAHSSEHDARGWAALFALGVLFTSRGSRRRKNG